MAHPLDSVAFTVPVGNDQRYVKCACGATFKVPLNALSVVCERCGTSITTTTRPGVMQR